MRARCPATWRSSSTGREEPDESLLDAEQLRAVPTHGGTVQVIAPAGSGKTAVLIERIRELLRRGVSADRILATTFNRDAKRELTQRLAAVGVQEVQARTFHSLGQWILREEGLFRRDVKQLSQNQWKRMCALAARDTGASATRCARRRTAGRRSRPSPRRSSSA